MQADALIALIAPLAAPPQTGAANADGLFAQLMGGGAGVAGQAGVALPGAGLFGTAPTGGLGLALTADAATAAATAAAAAAATTTGLPAIDPALLATQVKTADAKAAGQLAVGTVPFTPGGKLDKNWVAGPGQTALFADWDAPVLDFAASGSAAPAASAIKWDTALGIDDQQIEVQLGMLPGGITQFDSTSVTQSIQADGTAFGNLTNIDINDNGFVTANFDNGVSRQIAQIALATFSNPDGLRAQSGNAYRVSLDSGTFNLKPPGSGGAGILSPSTLEASTVDLSSEFTGLITTQRAYSASAKIITTADQMLEELINIKR